MPTTNRNYVDLCDVDWDDEEPTPDVGDYVRMERESEVMDEHESSGAAAAYLMWSCTVFYLVGAVLYGRHLVELGYSAGVAFWCGALWPMFMAVEVISGL